VRPSVVQSSLPPYMRVSIDASLPPASVHIPAMNFQGSSERDVSHLFPSQLHSSVLEGNFAGYLPPKSLF
jgi:hypothetical protein